MAATIVSSKLMFMGPPDKDGYFVREEHTMSDGSILTCDSPHTPFGFDHNQRMRDRVATFNEIAHTRD